MAATPAGAAHRGASRRATRTGGTLVLGGAMSELTLVGLHDDGEHVVLEGPDGQRFRVRIDEALRATVRRDRPQLAQVRAELAASVPPREIQARIRAGASAEEIAEQSGMPVEIIRRYDGPVLAEREYVTEQAKATRIGHEAGALDDEARWLSETELFDEPIPRRHLAAVRDRVFDVEVDDALRPPLVEVDWTQAEPPEAADPAHRGVVGPPCGAPCSGDLELHLDGPGRAAAAAGVPGGRRRRDVAGRQAVRDQVTQERRAGLVPDPGRLGLLGDVLALGEHRPVVPADDLDRHAGLLGDLLCAGTGPDPGLDLARRHGRGQLGAHLCQLWPVTADGGAQRLVDAHAEPLPVRTFEHDMLAVVVQTHQGELAHGTSQDESATCPGDAPGGAPVCRTGRRGRRRRSATRGRACGRRSVRSRWTGDRDQPP